MHIDFITVLDHYVVQLSKFCRHHLLGERADNIRLLERLAVNRVDRDYHRIIRGVIFADTALQNERASVRHSLKAFLCVTEFHSDFAFANSSVVIFLLRPADSASRMAFNHAVPRTVKRGSAQRFVPAVFTVEIRRGSSLTAVSMATQTETSCPPVDPVCIGVPNG